MKLRIHDSSIRLRLTRSEVGRFGADGAIESTFEFGPGATQCLRYLLKTTPGSAIAVQVEDGEITVHVPQTVAREWCQTDQVAISARQELGGGKQLDVLVEKEFRRLHGARFDPDLYPNPLEPKDFER